MNKYFIAFIFALIAESTLLNAAPSEGHNEGLCVEIAGIDTRSLKTLFSALAGGFKNETLVVKGNKLTCSGTIRILNIARSANDGSVQLAEFTKGDAFVVVYPAKDKALAILNLDMGFEYQMEFEAKKGEYQMTRSGVTTQGTRTFLISGPPKPTKAQ